MRLCTISSLFGMASRHSRSDSSDAFTALVRGASCDDTSLGFILSTLMFREPLFQNRDNDFAQYGGLGFILVGRDDLRQASCLSVNLHDDIVPLCLFAHSRTGKHVMALSRRCCPRASD